MMLSSISMLQSGSGFTVTVWLQVLLQPLLLVTVT
jgi:hypothetical protein